MPKKKALTVISDEAAKTRGVMMNPNAAPDFVFFRGAGQTDYVCGKCGRKLARKMPEDPRKVQTLNGALKCPKCGAVNDIGQQQD